MNVMRSILRACAIAACLTTTAALATPDDSMPERDASARWKAYMDLGAAAFAHGLHDEAGRYYELAVRQARSFGYTDRRLTRTLTLLGKVYEVQKRFDDAGQAFEEALAVDQMMLSAEHPLVMRDLLSIADLHYKQGHFALSEPYFRRLAEASRSRYGPDHPNTAMTLNDLAVLYVADKRYAEAERLFLQTIDILEAAAAEAFSAMAMENYASLLDSLHRHDEAGRLRLRLRNLVSDR